MAHTVRMYSMRISVVLLRSRGRVLTRSELPDPVVGTLSVQDWPAPNALRRSTRCAKLMGGTYSIPTDVVPTLFDPQIVKADETGMYMLGIELDASDTQRPPTEHLQMWLCRPAGD